MSGDRLSVESKVQVIYSGQQASEMIGGHSLLPIFLQILNGLGQEQALQYLSGVCSYAVGVACHEFGHGVALQLAESQVALVRTLMLVQPTDHGNEPPRTH